MAAVLALAPHADARGLLGNSRIVLKEGRLADALRDLSVRSGSDLLFAPDVVGDLRSRRIAADLQVEPILSRLLEGTGLGYRRVGDRTWVVSRLEPEQPTALPEVLVIGRKAQNADIRRTENDIQGYRVATAEDVRSSHADNLDQFLRSRQSNNAERIGPASDPRGSHGSNRSEVDFHGLGASQTLVLVDGTRMPSTLSQNFDLNFYQPDVNGLPLLAIDRIESLTGTAGGIYGPGATGGVINVILKRDYRGAEISTTYGATLRGDGARRRVDARIAFTPDHGATDVMINVSRALNDGLRFGDRNFAKRGLFKRIERSGVGGAMEILNGILVESAYGDTLTLSPALGGASLGSTFTWLPLNTAGARDGSVLLANAGKIPTELSPDGNGALRSLTSATTVTSVLLNARHRFGDHIEAVVDFVGWENQGRSVSAYGVTHMPTGLTMPGAGAPSTMNYPFGQPVTLTMPFPGLESLTTNRLRTTRASAKVIFDLPATWRGEASYAEGESDSRVREVGWAFDQNFAYALIFMQPGANGEPAPQPFGAWDRFVAALQTYKVPSVFEFERKLRLRDAAVRLGGPVLRRAPGDVALSLVAERREEKATLSPVYENGYSPAPRDGDTAYEVVTSSLYGELRAPIVSRASELDVLRGLELQLAARHDVIQADIPAQLRTDPRIRYDRSAAVYTAGLRVFPRDWLLLRASVATGVLPATPEQTSQGSFTLTAGPGYQLNDNRRGGELVGAQQPVPILTHGSANLRPERARTLALGFVFNPDGGRGPRISLDYTRTEKRGEISEMGGAAWFLTNEAAFPGRISRAPLTPADIAAGYSGGVITQIDATLANVSRTSVEAVDFHADQVFRMGSDRRLRLYGAATWTPRLTRQLSGDRPELDYVGTADGPLRWRGSAGVVWDQDDISIQLDAQYYDDYSTTSPRYAYLRATATPAPPRIPAQVYLDAAMSWRLQVGAQGAAARDVELRIGIQNLLDHDPPIEASYFGFSPYGDPRGRRFEFSASARF